MNDVLLRIHNDSSWLGALLDVRQISVMVDRVSVVTMRFNAFIQCSSIKVRSLRQRFKIKTQIILNRGLLANKLCDNCFTFSIWPWAIFDR